MEYDTYSHRIGHQQTGEQSEYYLVAARNILGYRSELVLICMAVNTPNLVSVWKCLERLQDLDRYIASAPIHFLRFAAARARRTAKSMMALAYHQFNADRLMVE